MLPPNLGGFPNPHDITAAAIVIGGTLLATVLRAGPRESMRTLRMLFASWRGGFDADAMRARLAPQVQQFNMDGLVRARPLPTGDGEIDTALAALVAQRSVEAMQAAHLGGRERRLATATSGVRVLAQASELAPVAGLGATLVALTQLPAGIAHGEAMGAIGMAVHATLMGLVLAHIVLVPLAASAERYALALETGRSEIVAWLADQLIHAGPGGARGRAAADPVHREPVETIELHAPHRARHPAPAEEAPPPAAAPAEERAAEAMSGEDIPPEAAPPEAAPPKAAPSEAAPPEAIPADPILAPPPPIDAEWAAAAATSACADAAPVAAADPADRVAIVPVAASPMPPAVPRLPAPALDAAVAAPWLTPYLTSAATRAPLGNRP